MPLIRFPDRVTARILIWLRWPVVRDDLARPPL